VLGNITSQTNNLGETTTYQYDQLYRLTNETDPNSAETLYTYDLQGNLLSLSDPVGNVTSYTYDDLNRLVLEEITVDSQTLSRSTEYDLTGAVTRQVDRQGRVRDFTYDALHRRLSETWYANVTDADSQANPLNDIDTTYDAVDRLMAITDDFSDYAYTYDQLDRLLTTTASHPGMPEVTLTNGYTRKDNLRTSLAAEIDSVDDFFNAYEYDDLGRLTRIEQSAQTGGNAVPEKRIDFSYDLSGRFAGIDRYEDLTNPVLVLETVFGYDGEGRLTDLAHSSGATTFADYEWEFDTSGRITDFSATFDDSNYDQSAAYTYDDAGQLTAGDWTGTYAPADESYTYDDNGNRTYVGGQQITTGDHNRLENDGTFTYQYDAEGNRTSRTRISTAPADDYQIVYAWDHLNRLVGVTFKDEQLGVTKEITNLYDTSNRWIGQKVDTDGDGDIDVATSFVYDGNQIVLRLVDAHGDGPDGYELTDRYVWGPQVDQILATDQIDPSTGDTDTLWTLTDNLGAVRQRALYNAGSGATAIVDRRSYDAFGNLTNQAGTHQQHLIGFTGRPLDAHAGLQNNLHRWYDAATGRWISEDPIKFEAGDANLSRYVGNNATNAVDPDGLEVVLPWDFGKNVYRETYWYDLSANVKDALGFRHDRNGRFPKDWQVHHVYQQSAGKWVFDNTGIRVHEPENLVGVPKFVHDEITQKQNEWWLERRRQLAKKTGRPLDKIKIQDVIDDGEYVTFKEYKEFTRSLKREYSKYWLKPNADIDDFYELLRTHGVKTDKLPDSFDGISWTERRAARETVRSLSTVGPANFSKGAARRFNVLSKHLGPLARGASVVGRVFAAIGVISTAKSFASPNEAQRAAFREFHDQYAATLANYEQTGEIDRTMAAHTLNRFKSYIFTLDMPNLYKAKAIQELEETHQETLPNNP